MKIIILLCTATLIQGFIFDSCTTDADCNGGCCEQISFSTRCVVKSGYLQSCSTTGCGCKPGLVCVRDVEIKSSTINIQPGVTKYLCEIQPTSSPSPSS